MNINNSGFEPIVTDRQTVKIKLTSRHIVHDMERFAKYGNFMTMFDPRPVEKSGHTDPEDYPEEMNDALSEILERENSVIGYPTEEELLEYCTEEDEEPVELPAGDSFSDKLEMFLRLLDENEGCDDDSFVFETLGTIERVILEDGRRVVEVSYTEEDRKSVV